MFPVFTIYHPIRKVLTKKVNLDQPYPIADENTRARPNYATTVTTDKPPRAPPNAPLMAPFREEGFGVSILDNLVGSSQTERVCDLFARQGQDLTN
jgi:hypothetical protein